MFKEIITTEVYENGELVSRDRKVNTDIPTLADIEHEASEPELSWEPSKPLRDKVEKCQRCDLVCDDSCYPGDPCCYDRKGEPKIAPDHNSYAATGGAPFEELAKAFDNLKNVTGGGETGRPYLEDGWDVDSYTLTDREFKMIMFAERAITMLIGAGAAILFSKRLRK